MKNKIVAIVQARMGSTRLPNKMMLHLNGHPVIEWIHQRMKNSKLLNDVVFAIPESPNDNVLANDLLRRKAHLYRGSESDVLERFYQAGKEYGATHVVRICADNPFVSASEIDHLIEFYFNNPCDYAYNHVPKGNLYPDGLGGEICSFEFLGELHRRARDKGHREHLFNYMWENQHHYRIRTFDPIEEELKDPSLKLDLDTFEDYDKLLQIPVTIQMSALEIVRKVRETLQRKVESEDQ